MNTTTILQSRAIQARFSPPDPAQANGAFVFDRDELLTRTGDVLDGRHPGVLTTADRAGIPRPRWMATLSFEAFPILYALTSPHSRKLEDLQVHPDVSWLFANEDMSMTVTLNGKAAEIFDPYEIKHVWSAIEDKHQAYFLREQPCVTVIGTVVDTVECCLPMRNFRVPFSIEELCPKVGSGA